MLVLSRKKGERIRIGGNILVEVVEIRSDRVRLAFSAPREVSIHREEIWIKIYGGSGDSGKKPETPIDGRY